jgi:hypothetical protein
VRYVRSNALEEFWKNYKHELIALRLSQGVKQFEIDNPDV